MKRHIVFEVECEGIVKIVEIDIPKNILFSCADKYIATLFQNKYRNGRGEYGKLAIGKDEFEYVEK